MSYKKETQSLAPHALTSVGAGSQLGDRFPPSASRYAAAVMSGAIESGHESMEDYFKSRSSRDGRPSLVKHQPAVTEFQLP
jgi:hypothetical protein